MDDGHTLTEEMAEHPVGGGMSRGLAFDGVVKLIAVLLPVARFGDPGQAVIEGGFDQAMLPVLERGFEGVAEFIIGQLVDGVATGTEEFGGIANNNHD